MLLKKAVQNIATLFITLVAFFLVGEVFVRIYLAQKYDSGVPGENAVGYLSLDERLGWFATKNHRFVTVSSDASGKEYKVDYSTDERGFRTFGDLKSRRKRLLFVGDSYTQAIDVSNDKTYYGLIARDSQFEVFACGVGGYGTLQEYFIVDQFIESIEPHAVIIQFCHNDFINNSYDLELHSSRNNNGMQRPYLGKDENIFYAIPKRFPALRSIANKYSSEIRLPLYALYRIDKLIAQYGKTVEDEIQTQGMNFLPFSEAAKITSRIFRMLRSRVSDDVEVYVFNVDKINPYHDQMISVLDENEIELIDGIPGAIRQAEKAGLTTRARDNVHWNEVGHRIAAQTIGSFLKERFKAL